MTDLHALLGDAVTIFAAVCAAALVAVLL